MEEMTVSKREGHNAEGTGVLPRAEIVRDEHPLSLGKTSVWNKYFQVTEIEISCWWPIPNVFNIHTLDC
jgi:TBC1 domain family member 13